ncbi:MAG: phosphatidylglycerol lysyltransferase domain-containing protein [Spirochaetaceae bacterium]|jgi:hypothetical protein|nr:phosphatidylglycerol lysyltransferase domain-containing protein [Spirochaetaceae bacterium]
MLPRYPEFTSISLDLKNDMQTELSKTVDGVSEFTFANLYLFRARYNYQISSDSQGVLLVSGERDGKKFFETPCGVPEKAVLEALLDSHSYWKCIPQSILEANPNLAGDFNIEITEDRDNFDYLYLKTDLSLLSGKKFHKKRNLVNAFMLSYPQHSEAPLTKDNISHAISVLDRWRDDKGSDGDYTASREALELFEELGLQGAVYSIRGTAAAYCLGESLSCGTMFGLHFEKGIDEYKGIYQFINQSFAASLADNFVYINREQDLGDEGLRQAKMTYRPCGFVQKFTGLPLRQKS